MESSLNEIEQLLAVLFKFLAASLVIERILEYADKVFTFAGLTGGNSKMLIQLSDKRLSEDDEKKRVVLKMLLMQVAGIIGGVIICYSSKLGIARELGFSAAAQPMWWDLLLSGLLISGGAEPIHSLINFLKGKKEEVQKERQELEAQKEIEPVPMEPAKPGSRFPELGIRYKGGLYPDLPGHGLRKVDPKYIVVHHSATTAETSFEQIVEIEKQERSNQKGSYQLDPSYHCVITNDGKQNHYTRWDSVGWHTARGPAISNSNSLGLCFVGNFENRKNVKGYNTEESNPKPTEKQIESGARILALWRYLYEIDEKNIVAHKFVKKRHTACPGNNFPFDRLAAKSSQVLSMWKEDKKILGELERFKTLPYLYSAEQGGA